MFSDPKRYDSRWSLETVIAAVYTCKNEADIVELSFRHMLNQGIDHIFTTDHMSTDGTRHVIDSLAIETSRITVIDDNDPYYMQVQRVNELCEIAGGAGAEWIICSDVDEFWYATNGGTTAEALNSCTDDKVCARSYQHLDWDTRQVEPKPLPKVAFRWRPGAQVAIGNHGVDVGVGTYGVLDLREIQYRGFEHFCRKAVDCVANLDPSLSDSFAWHHKKLIGLTEDQLRIEWDAMCAIPTVHDPVPGSVR